MKKYMKYMLVVAMLTTSINVFSQTTTVTFKPNATVGKDAVLIKETNGRSNRYDNTNYGNYPELSMLSWTDVGSSYTLANRSLIKFTQLNSIPSNAFVVGATLKLYGVPNSTNFPHGNTSVPSGNASCIQRVISNWDENTVTWNTQPTATGTGQINIPSSTSQWNFNYTNNSTELINMVQNMVSNPNSNYGFMIRLQGQDDDVASTRSMLFASSDHSNSALWPTLIVTYEPTINCEFTTCVSTTDQDLYTFSAVNTFGDHNWIISDGNGNQIYSSNSSSFSYTLPAGNYSVDHYVTTDYQSCSSYNYFCVDQSQQAAAKSKKEGISDATNTPLEITKSNTIKVYPNPSSDDWNVTLTSENAESVDVIITDCSGKIVSNDKKNLTKGDNSFIVQGDKLPKGIYVLEIKGETTNFTQKLSKN